MGDYFQQREMQCYMRLQKMAEKTRWSGVQIWLFRCVLYRFSPHFRLEGGATKSVFCKTLLPV